MMNSKTGSDAIPVMCVTPLQIRSLDRNSLLHTWMWFIFPQFEGLGHSETARFYAIKSLDEAQQYLNHPVLGARLTECSEIVLGFKGRSVEDIFGFPDHLKFSSCMTLFSCVADSDPVFNAVLDQFFEGKPDNRTLELLGMR
jgi:uncharacterized protein (DUF1810 family)